MCTLRTPIRSPPIKKSKTDTETLARNLEHQFSDDNSGGSAGKSKNEDFAMDENGKDNWMWGRGWYWSQSDDWQTSSWAWQDWQWRPSRQYSWHDYEQPPSRSLLQRKETAKSAGLASPVMEGSGQNELAEIPEEPARVEPAKVEKPAAIVKQETANDTNASKKMWNRDKHGNLLSGKAMYQRFYRSIRSQFDSK